jgi:hypothetical protein
MLRRFPRERNTLGGLRFARGPGDLACWTCIVCRSARREIYHRWRSMSSAATWMIGNRYQFGSLVRGVHKLIEAGYAVAAIDYRLSRQAIFPAQIHDVKSAIYWPRERVPHRP